MKSKTYITQAVFFRLIQLFLVIFWLGFCISCSQSKDRARQEFATVGMRWEPRTFNPFRSVDSASYFAQSLVFAGLVRYDAEGLIEGDLAEEFKIDETKTLYEFKIRKNLRFSDGSKLTAIDVVASIKEAAGKRSPFRKNFELMESVKARGSIVDVKFKGPDVSLLSRFVDLKILPSKVLQADKKTKSKYDRTPVSSGPFQVENWISGQALVFRKNPYYWDKSPEIEKLAWKVIPDKKLLAMALIRKEIDIASVGGREAKQLLNSASHLNVKEARGSRVVFLGFNTNRDSWSPSKVRQALCMFIDRKAIKKMLYANYAQIPDSEFYQKEDPGQNVWPYDVEKAKECLKEAGYSYSGKTWVNEAANNEVLAIKIVTVKDFVDLAQVIVSSFNRVGIKAETEILDYATLKDQYLKEGSFDAVLFSRSVGPMPDPRMFWSREGGLNYSKYSSPNLEKLINEGSKASTLEEKLSINRKVGKELAIEVPWIYLERPNLLVAHDRRVSNVIRGSQKEKGIPWNNFLLNARLWKFDKRAY